MLIKKMNNILNKSFIQWLYETPLELEGGDSNGNVLKTDNKTIKDAMYNRAYDFKTVKVVGDYLLKYKKEGNKFLYRLMDVNKKEIVFLFNYEKTNKSKIIPFAYNSITMIAKLENINLEKTWVVNFIYDTMVIKSNIPFLSDKQQYKGGFIMWNRLIAKALADNLFCYVIAMQTGDIIELNIDNYEANMKKYYNKDSIGYRYCITKNSLIIK